jgi:hypothetical protein
MLPHRWKKYGMSAHAAWKRFLSPRLTDATRGIGKIGLNHNTGSTAPDERVGVAGCSSEHYESAKSVEQTSHNQSPIVETSATLVPTIDPALIGRG